MYSFGIAEQREEEATLMYAIKSHYAGIIIYQTQMRNGINR